MDAIIKFLYAEMERPKPYGWFHLVAVALVIGIIIAIVFTCKNISDKKFRIICLTVAGVMLAMELYKQLTYSFDPDTGVWDYQWYAFPFQFCSTPMYVLLLIGLLKPCKFRDFLCSFMATFSIVAGVAVMLLPTTVFISQIGINIQTMYHHGAMIVMGVFVWVAGRAKGNLMTLLKGSAVFLALVSLAFIMNVIYHSTGNPETFNMFFIDWHYNCELPVLSIIQEKVPYVIFLFLYIFAFCLAGLIVCSIAILIKKVAKIIKEKKEQKYILLEEKNENKESLKTEDKKETNESK